MFSCSSPSRSVKRLEAGILFIKDIISTWVAAVLGLFLVDGGVSPVLSYPFKYANKLILAIKSQIDKQPHFTKYKIYDISPSQDIIQ